MAILYKKIDCLQDFIVSLQLQRAQIYDETTKTVALGKEKSLSARKVREVQGIIQDKIQIEKTTIKEGNYVNTLFTSTI